MRGEHERFTVHLAMRSDMEASADRSRQLLPFTVKHGRLFDSGLGEDAVATSIMTGKRVSQFPALYGEQRRGEVKNER